jgi:hypothetical protein
MIYVIEPIICFVLVVIFVPFSGTIEIFNWFFYISIVILVVITLTYIITLIRLMRQKAMPP